MGVMLNQDEANTLLKEIWAVLDGPVSDEWDRADKFDALWNRLEPLNLGNC